MRLQITILTLLLTLGGALSAQAAKEKFDRVKIHVAAQAVEVDVEPPGRTVPARFAAEAVLLRAGKASGVIHVWRPGGQRLSFRVVGGLFDERELSYVCLKLERVGDRGERIEGAMARVRRHGSSAAEECLIWEIVVGDDLLLTFEAVGSIRFGDGVRGGRPPSDS